MPLVQYSYAVSFIFWKRKLTSLEDWRDAERVWKDYRETGDLEMLRKELQTNVLIINMPDELEGFVYAAIADKDLKAADLLIELGILDVTETADDGFHHIHVAVEDSDDDPAMVEWLLSKGVDIEQRGFNDWTPLHLAAIRGLPNVVSFLIEKGADINARTRIDCFETPLMEAAYAGRIDVVKVLLERGADYDLLDAMNRSADRTALQAGNEDVARCIREHREKHNS